MDEAGARQADSGVPVGPAVRGSLTAAALAEAVEGETRAALAGERAKAASAAAAAGAAGAGGDTGAGRGDA
eukprot:2526963-Pleurochrysis_carterae.AAC.1